jgi:hypothetical protein
MEAPAGPAATAEAAAGGGLRSIKAVSESFIALNALSATTPAQPSSGAWT